MIKKKDGSYLVEWGDIYWGTDEELATWGADPKCGNAKECIDSLEKRKGDSSAALAPIESHKAAEAERKARVRAELQDNPFDPRHEVSADAKHIASRIVKHLWIIFVALPLALGLVYLLLHLILSGLAASQ